MRLFLDTAKLDEIRQAAKWGVISGVTTNPTLMMQGAKGSGRPWQETFKATVQEICFIVRDSVSAEVTSLDADGMVAEAAEIATWSPYATIKVPIIPAGLEAISRINRLAVDTDRLCSGCAWQSQCTTYGDEAKTIVADGVATNATLAFSANQGLLAALAGATYVSPFVGRLDDIGNDGMTVVRDLVDIFERYGLETQVIAASIRTAMHVTQAAKAGADIATVPFAVLNQMVKHSLTDVGMKRFLDDWEKFKAG
jgi:transaldolase